MNEAALIALVGAVSAIGVKALDAAIAWIRVKHAAAKAQKQRHIDTQARFHESSAQIAMREIDASEEARAQLWAWVKEAKESRDRCRDDLASVRMDLALLQKDHASCFDRINNAYRKIGLLHEHVDELRKMLLEHRAHTSLPPRPPISVPVTKPDDDE